MLIKILFTLAVVVAVIFRVKNQTSTSGKSQTKQSNDVSGVVSSHVLIYTLLGVIVAISALIFVLHWSAQHEIVNIRVTNSQGETVHYQAHKKWIKGRQFTTLDGVSVTLGTSDRVEMLGKD